MEINSAKQVFDATTKDVLTLRGATSIVGATTITGNTAVTGTLTTTGVISSGAANIATTSGNAVIGGYISAGGNITAAGDLNTYGDLEVTASNGSILELKVLEGSHTVVGGNITETITDAIPANSLVLAVTCRVTTIVVMATGVNFDIGVANALTRYGENVLLAAGTTTTMANYPDATPPVATPIYYPTTESILLTGDAGTFTSGAIRYKIYYFTVTAPTS